MDCKDTETCLTEATEQEANVDKFTLVALDSLLNLTPGTMTSPWDDGLPPKVAILPAGAQRFWGIPFTLGAEGRPRWLELRPRAPVIVPLKGRAGYVVLVHFCNTSLDDETRSQWPEIDPSYDLRPGEHLADYVLVYADGAEYRQPIRRGFEINSPIAGQAAFAARPHSSPGPLDWRGPYARNGWGWAQGGVSCGDDPVRYWVYALASPYPDKELALIRLEPTGTECLALAGLTLCRGQEHPLRYRRLDAFRVMLPAGEAKLPEQMQAEIDMGIIARKYAVPAFDPEQWLGAAVLGWGEKRGDPQPTSDLRLDITASPDATLAVDGHVVDLWPAYETGTGVSRDGVARVEFLGRERTWVHVTIEDAATGQATPARIHFRSPDGRYIPPYGHRHEVNDNWFEDYGADLKLGSTEYAYVDGRCQVYLPVGPVYVEIAKGFEYQPVRERVEIKPGQRELRFRLQRPLDYRQKGWVTADTHVHFISPQTAWLEAQGEGLNLVNLLASQWGDLFTNVGDLTGGLSGVSTRETLVWVGTENRQHIMGHISLLGGKGQPVYPMTTDGPPESYLGDPMEASMAEWADRCREREGIVVIPHFPYPQLEVTADIILGKVDAVEIRDFGETLHNHCIHEWYRFLNMGYRVGAVGGTDKMSAGTAVGSVRTYANIGDEDFDFASWAKAVRSGRTFTTNGPLVGLSVEGHAPGDEIRLPAKGGTLEVDTWADSLQPIHDLQIVVNSQVVDQVSQEEGTRQLRLRTKVRLPGSGWIAARCRSRLKLWHNHPVHIAAHTSPVYVVAGGQETFNPSDAVFMSTLLDGGLTYLDTLSIPANAQKHEEIRKVFRQAQEVLHQRTHALGLRHGH